jgi:hypothetical protein
VRQFRHLLAERHVIGLSPHRRNISHSSPFPAKSGITGKP